MPSLPPIDKDDLWLMDAVVEQATSVRLLLLPDVEVAMNMGRSHGLTFETLAEKLFSLCQRDLIQVLQLRDYGRVARTREDVLDALTVSRTHSEETFYYRLTTLGGTVWEDHARPDWSRFIISSANIESLTGTIEAASRESAEAKFQSYLEGDGFPTQQPLVNSRRGQDLNPWHATDWKILPQGYQLDYDWVPREEPRFRRRSAHACPSFWYTRLALDD